MTKCLIVVLLVAVLSSHCWADQQRTARQRLANDQSEFRQRPANDQSEFRLNAAEILLGTKMLPNGIEIMSYLYKDVTSRFYFMIEDEDVNEVSVFVSPCASRVTWSLFSQYLPIESSGDYVDDENDHEEEDEDDTSRDSSGRTETLTSYTGYDVTEFRVNTTSSLRVGTVYCIAITALEIDSQVRMSAETRGGASAGLASIYPQLPVNSQIVTRFVGKRGIELRWKPSPSTSRPPFPRTNGGKDIVRNLGAGDVPIEYCVAVNRKRYLATHCAARQLVFGPVLPTAPSNAGFRFSWQISNNNDGDDDAYHNDNNNNNNNNNNNGNQRETMSGQAVNNKDEDDADDDVFYKCIGSRTSFTYTSVHPGGHAYYFNVYAVNRRTNSSSAYKGTRVVTKTDDIPRIEEGHLVVGTLTSRRTGSSNLKSYRFTNDCTDGWARGRAVGRLNMGSQHELERKSSETSKPRTQVRVGDKDTAGEDGDDVQLKLFIAVQRCAAGRELNVTVSFDGGGSEDKKIDVSVLNRDGSNNNRGQLYKSVESFATKKEARNKLREGRGGSSGSIGNSSRSSNFGRSSKNNRRSSNETSSINNSMKDTGSRGDRNNKYGNIISNMIGNKSNSIRKNNATIVTSNKQSNKESRSSRCVNSDTQRMFQTANNDFELKTITIFNPVAGSYTINIGLAGGTDSAPNNSPYSSVPFQLMVWSGSVTSSRSASRDVQATPFPSLPSDVRVQTFDKLNTCHSVTLAWMGTKERQLYCLYARELLTSPRSSANSWSRTVVHPDSTKDFGTDALSEPLKRRIQPKQYGNGFPRGQPGRRPRQPEQSQQQQGQEKKQRRQQQHRRWHQLQKQQLKIQTQQRNVTNRCVPFSVRPKEERVSCRYFQALDDRRSVVTETVTSLKESTKYAFDVYVVKHVGAETWGPGGGRIGGRGRGSQGPRYWEKELSLAFDRLVVKTGRC